MGGSIGWTSSRMAVSTPWGEPGIVKITTDDAFDRSVTPATARLRRAAGPIASVLIALSLSP